MTGVQTCALPILYTCLATGGNNVCQYKEVQLDKTTCKTGVVEQNLPKGSEFNKVKIATVCKG